MDEIKYMFFATLFDQFETYLHPDVVYDKYWGSMDEPSKTYEEFAKQTEQDLIDTINRVFKGSEAASKGTAFNALIDFYIHDRYNLHRNRIMGVKDHDSIQNFTFHPTVNCYEVETDGYDFMFPGELVEHVAGWYNHQQMPQSQVLVDGVIDTCHGKVKLYGYIDELTALDCHDIKTTGSYSVGQYKNHWQHMVYPYCLRAHGSDMLTFSYDVITWKKSYAKKEATPYIMCEPADYFREVYTFVPERDIPKLRRRCEEIIEFIQAHRSQITNDKIFNFRKDA